MELFFKTLSESHFKIISSFTRTEMVVYDFFRMEINGVKSKPVKMSYAEISEIVLLSRTHICTAFKSLIKKKVIKKTKLGYVLLIGVFDATVTESVTPIINDCENKNNETLDCNFSSTVTESVTPSENDNVFEDLAVTESVTDCYGFRNTSYHYNSTRDLSTILSSSSKAYKDNIFLKNGLNLDSQENTEIANVSEIAIQHTGIVTGRIKPNYDDPFQKLAEYNAKYRNESFRPENLLAFKKCVDLIINVWDASRRGDERKARKAFAESVVEDCYSADLIDRFEQAFYAYSKDEFQKKVKAMSLEKWASQWDNWTEVYIERTRNNEIKKIDPVGSYWILIREKLKG